MIRLILHYKIRKKNLKNCHKSTYYDCVCGCVRIYLLFSTRLFFTHIIFNIKYIQIWTFSSLYRHKKVIEKKISIFLSFFYFLIKHITKNKIPLVLDLQLQELCHSFDYRELFEENQQLEARDWISIFETKQQQKNNWKEINRCIYSFFLIKSEELIY